MDVQIKTWQKPKDQKGLSIHNKLNFNLHITELYKKSSAQFNALYRSINILPLKVKSILIQSFVYGISHLLNRKENYSLFRITVLNKTEKSQRTVYRLKSLCIEIFKTLHGLILFLRKTFLYSGIIF